MIMMTENLATKITMSNLPKVNMYINQTYFSAPVDTMKSGTNLKNMGNVLAKIVSIFGKMKLAGLLLKKRASFPSKICPVL